MLGWWVTGVAAFPRDSTKLACWYTYMEPGLEVCIGLVNLAEHFGVGVSGKLETDIQQVIDVRIENSPSMPTILSTNFFEHKRGPSTRPVWAKFDPFAWREIPRTDSFFL